MYEFINKSEHHRHTVQLVILIVILAIVAAGAWAYAVFFKTAPISNMSSVETEIKVRQLEIADNNPTITLSPEESAAKQAQLEQSMDINLPVLTK